MKRNTILILSGFVLLGITAICPAQSTIDYFASRGRGWYTANAAAFNAGNYMAGYVDSRNDWFLFDLSLIIGSPTDIITSAQLRLFNPPTGASGSGTFQVWDVSTSLTDLQSGANPATTYADLGSGVSYGSQAFSSADNNNYITVNLNGDFISAAQNALANGQMLAVGGSLANVSSQYDYLLGSSGNLPDGATMLILNVTQAPEPSTITLSVIGGITGLIAFRRRRVRACSANPQPVCRSARADQSCP
jgi:hypothetical protein